MNRMLYVFVVMVTCLCTSELLYAQQRILIPLDSVVSVPDTAYAHYWVDTLGSGFRINTNRPDYPLIKERLYTTLPHHLRIVEDIIDLSATVSVGDTMRKTMFKPAYQSWYDSLQTMAQEFGGATYVLKNFTNYDSSWNVSGWTIFFTDTILSVAVEERIRSMNLYTIHSSPTIFLIEPDPFRRLTSVEGISIVKTLKKVELHPFPASSYIHISIPYDKSLLNTMIAEFVSINGVIVARQEVILTEVDGKLSGTLPLSGISNGVYLVRIGDYTKLITVVQ